MASTLFVLVGLVFGGVVNLRLSMLVVYAQRQISNLVEIAVSSTRREEGVLAAMGTVCSDKKVLFDDILVY